MQQLVLKHKWALGDTVLLTGLVRDIHRAYPERFQIQVDTHFTNVWEHNPHVVKFEKILNPLRVEVGWGDAIRWNGYAQYGARREMRHILAWYHYDFERKTGLTVPVTESKPDLHLSEAERARRITGRYWVILSGGKLDVTVKHWHAHRAQEVVDKLAYQNISCVQVGAAHTNHIHPPLQNCLNLVGKTENARDLFNIIAHSDGVICGVTAAMHIAAAFNKPCVVYAGGREEPWFEGYVNGFNAFGPSAQPVQVEHKFLHTISLLPCCDKQGCWKKRTVPVDPADLTTKSYTLCRQPIRPETTHAVAACQDLITSDHVLDAVMEYYDKKVLPPIGAVRSFPSTHLNQPAPAESYAPQVELIRVRPEAVTELPLIELTRDPSVPVRVQPPHQQVHPRELTAAGVGIIKKNLSILDNSIIGGKITICVLCYGPHTDLAKKCLNSILATVPPERLDLRVATNDVVPATLAYLKTLPVSCLYVNSTNRHKYPVMREMFWDAQRPITTKYLLWLDDDTWVVRPDWITNLAQTIVDSHNYGYRMYGSLMYHDLSAYMRAEHNPKTWFASANWYRNKHFRTKSGQAEAPNGSIIDFAVGWCWAAEVEALRQANVPDIRLGHNGGDITIGEQMHQAGFMIKPWNRGKTYVACPSREQGGRRGYSEKFPWDTL